MWENWTKSVEVEVLQQSFGAFQSFELDWIDPTEAINEPDRVQYDVSYELRAVPQGAPGDTVTYAAKVVFDVYLDAGSWRLRVWEEVEWIPSPDGGFYKTWGFLKGTLRQQLGG